MYKTEYKGSLDMAAEYKQTYHRKPKFLRIMAILFGSMIISNLTVNYFLNRGDASLAQTSSVVVFITCVCICIALIYKNLSYYTYEIFDNKLFFERAIGKSNHIYFCIEKKDLIEIFKYTEKDKKEQDPRKRFKFVIDHDSDKWYVIDFMKDDKRHRLVINPNSNFLNGIEEWKSRK